MIYLLTDHLPRSVSVEGVPFEVETDFRLFVAFERDASLGRWQPYDTLLQFYRGHFPTDINAAAEAFMEFYRQGKFDPVDSSGKPNYPTSGKERIPFAFDVDDRRIYSAFRSAYGIDLSREKLHWYSFRALFENLFDAQFGDIVGYRLADLSKLPKEDRKHKQKIQRAYEIKRESTETSPDENLDGWAARIRAKLEGGE